MCDRVAASNPALGSLPQISSSLRGRFADQRWLIKSSAALCSLRARPQEDWIDSKKSCAQTRLDTSPSITESSLDEKYSSTVSSSSVSSLPALSSH